VMETIQLLGGDGDGIEGWLGKRSGEASEDSAGLSGCNRSLGCCGSCDSLDGIEGWLGKRSGEASEDSAGLRPFPRLLRFV